MAWAPTERDRHVLVCLAQYFLLNRRQIQGLCYVGDGEGRITRRRLSALHRHKLINKYDGGPDPVYFLAKAGCQYLAEEHGDDTYLLKPTHLSRPHHVRHFLAVSDTHITLDAAIANQNDVKHDAWFGETEYINPHEDDPEKRCRLFSELRTKPRLVCDPDAAFLLNFKGHCGVFYLEQDRGSWNSGTSPTRLAAYKSPGYAELVKRKRHRQQFPTTTLDYFTVLSVSPTPGRRDSLRRAFAKVSSDNRPDHWRFAAVTDLTPETFLFNPVWHRHDRDEAGPLVRK